MKRIALNILAVLIVSSVVIWAQTKVNVKQIDAAPTGEKVAASSDAVSLPTDRGGSIPILYDTNTNGKTTLLTGVSMQTVYVRGLSIINDTASSVTVSLGSGTGTNCGTTYTAKTPAYLLDGTSSTANHKVELWPFSANGAWMKTAAGENLCISTSAGVQLRVVSGVDQF